MARDRSRGFPTRSRRRKTEWFEGVGSQSPLQVSSSSNGFLGAGLITSFGEETMVRHRGLFVANLVSATSAGDGFIGAVGIGIVSSSAFTAGISSVPTPVTEMGWDGWLWHSFFEVHKGSVDGVGSEHQRIELDSKAMRKLEEAMTVYAAFEVTEIGTAAVDLFLDSRVLSMLA